MKPFVTVLLLVLLCWPAHLAPPGPEEPEPKERVVSVHDRADTVQRLRRSGADLLFVWEGRVYAHLDEAAFERLEQEGIPLVDETDRFPPRPSSDLAQAPGGINGAYHSHGELVRDLQSLAARFPTLARLESLGTSLEGRQIMALKVSARVASEEPEAGVFICGCHHAREWISVEVPFLLARYLLENYGQDSEITDLLEHCAVWVAPMINPDGLEYTVTTYRYWRKNRRWSGGSFYGVDVNRNYGYQWGCDNIGSSPYPGAETFRGTGPFSEPEVAAVRDFFSRTPIQAMISYHSYSQVIVYPWGYSGQPTADEAEWNALAAEMAARIFAVHGRRYAYGYKAGNIDYLTNGEMCDWAYATYRIPAFTIELPPVDWIQGGFLNAENDIEPVFAENLPALLFFIRYAIDHFTQGGDRP